MLTTRALDPESDLLCVSAQTRRSGSLPTLNEDADELRLCSCWNAAVSRFNGWSRSPRTCFSPGLEGNESRLGARSRTSAAAGRTSKKARRVSVPRR